MRMARPTIDHCPARRQAVRNGADLAGRDQSGLTAGAGNRPSAAGLLLDKTARGDLAIATPGLQGGSIN
ncbi:hypothetical protein J2Z17_002057 [Rhizobium halophytocola]|uniref:Uncharacterized protein n=1 Tax=Rhizobium halophytocola TaxID=735519 RepID=A0ABS4DY58_9HYPH|nr:hypothetical protein [Rhizobium halophytocola]